MSSYASSSHFGKPINKLGMIATMSESHDANFQKCIDLFSNTESFISQIKVPKVSDLTFGVDGITFHARNTPKGPVADLLIWAVLGYLPYSVTSQKKRNSLITILEASHGLPTVRFGIDGEMKIIATGLFEIENPPTPNYIFVPLITFLQEARPFINLIGEYL